MNTLNTLLTASVLALGACQEGASTPACNERCEELIASVAAKANEALSNDDKSRITEEDLENFDPSCKKAISKKVPDCIVLIPSSLGYQTMGIQVDSCVIELAEDLRKCAKKTIE